jgi:formylglycine-generating enzyme required for sulfatase activity
LGFWRYFECVQVFPVVQLSRSANMKSTNILLSIVAAVAMTFGVSTSSVHAQCASDITGDGQINGADLSQLLADWGSCLAGAITSVTPLQGSVLGGTQITINGTNLSGTTAVKIGGVDCTNLQVLSPTVVKAVTPAGAAGEASIAIVSAAGSTLVPTPFSYVLQSITSVSPNIGIYSGGTAITITGTFLSGATSVKVGGVPATDVVAVNSTTVTAVTPCGSVGAASVEVTGAKGTATASGAFTYWLDPIVPTWATLLEAAPDPTVVTEAKRFAAIVASGFAWRIRDNSSNIEMLLVPAGPFTMGCSPGDDECNSDESPTHQVTLTQAFYMGKTEVTQAEWAAKMGSNPSYFYGLPNNPVEQVSWNMIQGFNSATGLRLPTEAEWETACRAGTTGATDGELDLIAWYDLTVIRDGTQPVAGKLPNAIGLYDTLGNVFEWCQDWYGSTYYASSPLTNPTGPTTGSSRLWRGGGWGSDSNACRASQRKYGAPDVGYPDIGFRVVRNP